MPPFFPKQTTALLWCVAWAFTILAAMASAAVWLGATAADAVFAVLLVFFFFLMIVGLILQ